MTNDTTCSICNDYLRDCICCDDCSNSYGNCTCEEEN